jgi:internalin A
LAADAGPRLEAVDLSGNALTALSAADLGSLRHVRELRLGLNALASLPEALRQLAGLTALSAPRNQLRGLPAAVATLSVLTTLELDDNR